MGLLFVHVYLYCVHCYTTVAVHSISYRQPIHKYTIQIVRKGFVGNKFFSELECGGIEIEIE